MGNLGRIVGSALTALTLSSCAIVDNFSSRAVDYNLVAEKAQQQQVLLNIVRASLNRPMQFTTLSSITGTASVTGNETLTAPFGEMTHRPKGLVSPDVFGLSGTISGGPTFTVPVLDTQEFYEGELKPLTGQEYRFFLDEGITPSVLFYMFVDTIQLTVADDTPVAKGAQKAPPLTLTFHSYVLDDFDNNRYETVADYLLAMGLNIEEAHHSETIGPPITAAQFHDLGDIAKLTTAGLHITPVKSEAQATGGTKPAKITAAGRYQIEKDMTVYRPCFARPSGAAYSGQIDNPLLCGSSDPSDTSEQKSGSLGRNRGGFTAPGLQEALDAVRSQYLANKSPEMAQQLGALPSIPPGAKLQVRLIMRSPEAILHFLGSLVTRELSPSSGEGPRVIRVKIGAPYLPYPVTRCDATPDPNAPQQAIGGYRCDNLFVLLRDQSTDSSLSVDYNGSSYSVPSDDRVQGRTTRMLDLVKQILALHTSAKELPASNVLNIIGGSTP